MFVNKIAGSPNLRFKGYQHVMNDVGDRVLRFNYPYDYEKQTCDVEFYKVEPAENYNYKLIEEPIARVKLNPEGVDVDLQSITNLDKEEAFAYRYVIRNKETGTVDNIVADSGIKVYQKDGEGRFRIDANEGISVPEYSFVSRKGTTPRVQGAGYLVFPDTQRVGYKYRGFDEPNTGEIYFDKDAQKDAENTIRTFSNRMGGNLAGLEKNIDYLAANGYKVQVANPIVGGDNKSAHRYWNKNNFQIDDEMGNTENFASYTRKLFQKGTLYVYDGTFTSEGLEGIHFQYALRWADKNPQSYYWFKMQSLRDSNLGLGVVPRNKENLAHRIINSPVILEKETNKIVANPDYKAGEETYFQVYDRSQVSEDDLSRLDRPVENYRKIKAGEFLNINTHDDTLINYVFQVDPKEIEGRYREVLKFNKNNPKPIDLKTPDGTMFFSQFSNFKINGKTEGGFVAWDANSDMVKMNYHISGYDEKIDSAIVDHDEREKEKQLRVRGAYEVQDMALQSGKYWTKNFKDIQTIYTAQVLKGATTKNKIEELISNGLLPKEALITDEAVNNVLNGHYNLDKKGVLSKEDATIKALMQLPLDTLEFAENTVGVLSTSYFSNRATSAETLGLSRFDLMQQKNPHLADTYEKVYTKTNLLYADEIKSFADEIIKKVDANSTEKLLDVNGDYTEYGEYVIELMAPSISKYAFLKSLTGDKLKTKILPNGEITYDYKDIKQRTSLKQLGINATNPTDEAEQLLKLMTKGMKKLDSADVDYVAKSISERIQGTNVNSFRLAEAIVKKAALGLTWRLDAAKDVVDIDAGRNGDVAFDENWNNLIVFWRKFVEMVKSENPDSYIVAELTDIGDIMQATYGEDSNAYCNIHDYGQKFKTVHDAMIKLFNEAGITSEAAYSYFFTDLMKLFGPDFTNGDTQYDLKSRCNAFAAKFRELVSIRGIDYVRNLYTFVGNHDKPRVIHGLALNMKLFHGGLGVFNNDGKANYEANRYNRIESMLQLANADDFDSLPLEAKLNIDNPEYFNTVSTYAVAMSQLLRNAMNDSLTGVASKEEIAYLKSALVDLTNGNYLGKGKTTQIPSINIPELSSVENALKSMIDTAGISITEKDFNDIVARANSRELVEKFLVQGDFDWANDNNFVGEKNRENIEAILRGGYETIPSEEKNYMQYSTYTASVAGLLRQAFIDVKGDDANLRFNFLNATKEFVKKYDRATVEANRTKLPYLESHEAAMAKNGYASKDMKNAIEMLVQQAEYKARKDGKLGEEEHFKGVEKIIANVWQSATEPAVQKLIMMMAYLSAVMGIPTLFGGDELGMTGYDEKTKNLYLQCRNALPWSELEGGFFKEYRQRIQSMMNDAMSLRSKDGVDALNNGTAYLMETSDEYVPAFMMQDGSGNITVSVFNATDIDVDPRVDYFKKYGITEKNREKFFAENEIESINPNNRYVPIQKNKDIEAIYLAGGMTLPIGLTFMNADARDKAIYIVKKIQDKIGIVRQGTNEFIRLNGKTAKNGVMVLKHIAKKAKNPCFRGSVGYNKQYNLVTNPYQKIEMPVEGEKLSILAR